MMVYGFLDEHDERLLCEYMPCNLFVPGVHVFDVYFMHLFDVYFMHVFDVYFISILSQMKHCKL